MSRFAMSVFLIAGIILFSSFAYALPTEVTNPVLLALGNTSQQFYDINPVIYASKDSGTSWLKTDTIPDFPIDTATIRLVSVSCTGNLCSAGGNYSSPKDLKNRILLLASHDQGLSWRFIKNIPNLPADPETSYTLPTSLYGAAISD